MGKNTGHLGLPIPDRGEKGFIVSRVLEPGFTKIDQFAERIDTGIGVLSTLKTVSKIIVGAINELFTNKLDKGAGLKAANARGLEEQIEDLSKLKLLGTFSLASGDTGTLSENINNFEALVVMVGEADDDLCSVTVPKLYYNKKMTCGGLESQGGTLDVGILNYTVFNFPTSTAIKNISVYGSSATTGVLNKKEDGNTNSNIRRVYGLLKTQ